MGVNNKEIVQLSDSPLRYETEKDTDTKLKSGFIQNTGRPTPCMIKIYKSGKRLIKMFLYRPEDKDLYDEKIRTEVYFQKRALYLSQYQCKTDGSYEYSIPKIYSYGHITNHPFLISMDGKHIYDGPHIYSISEPPIMLTHPEFNYNGKMLTRAIVYYIEMDKVNGEPINRTNPSCRKQVGRVNTISRCFEDNELVHGDLTTDNVFVENENKLNIIDFGESTETSLGRNYIDPDVKCSGKLKKSRRRAPKKRSQRKRRARSRSKINI
jgi:hypothetical protein